VAFTPANSAHAASALVLVEALQRRMVEAMQGVAAAACDDRTPFVPTAWLRDGGRHGGGTRWGLGDTPVFDRASVNVSQVHYDDEPTKQLGSATALSTIIHPANPHAPSVHLHLSWTQMRDGSGYWRMMSDLNPSIPASTDAEAFSASLRRVSGPLYDGAAAQGGRYFWIPALGRHRGVSHFYLEAHDSGSFEDDAALARSIGETTIDTYAALVAASLRAHPQPTAADRATQLAYHTVYFFQVLTLDRGTTSGLLVHDQNDVGILGSLPSHLDRMLLAAWCARVPPEQAPLVSALLKATADDGERDGMVVVDEAKKLALAAAVRGFYRANPRALEFQAAGNVIPPTVANHR
jgi:coproporphyrinogen III oxidase